jgi:competence protein ComEA
MRKFLIALVALFAFSGFALAAVDLNTADQKQLESVKGIGPVKAKAIIDYRTKNGPFKSAEDLDKVKGFGAKTISKVGPDLTIGGKPLAVAVPGSSKAPSAKPTDSSTSSTAAPAAAADMKKPSTKEMKAGDSAAGNAKMDSKAGAKMDDKAGAKMDDKAGATVTDEKAPKKRKTAKSTAAETETKGSAATGGKMEDAPEKKADKKMEKN